jgi:hypothetical protein
MIPSRYPSAPAEYDPRQLDQLIRTLVVDLSQLGLIYGAGYNTGANAPSPIMTNGGLTVATASVGTVTVVTNGSTTVTVNSGTPADVNNVAQVLAALITDLKSRGMLG